MNGVVPSERDQRATPDTKIVVLTVHRNEEYILASFQAGSDGLRPEICKSRGACLRNKDRHERAALSEPCYFRCGVGRHIWNPKRD